MQVLGDDAAEGRSGDAGHDPRRAHIGLVAAALARRDHVGDVVCVSGTMPPPPIPCSVRPAINSAMSGAAADTTEPARNRPIASSIMARRPWMSESLP